MKDVSLLLENGVNVKKSLELFGDMETYDAMLNDFLIEIEPKVDKIKNYKELGDMANYAICVHSLKSDAKYFGFEKLAELAYDHELKSKANELYYITDHFAELIYETQRIINLVKKYKGINIAEINNKIEFSQKDKAILVVDDSNLIRNFILKIFKDDFDVLIANDGKEALDIVNNPLEFKRLKAILLDLNMPNVDGFEVLDYFQKNDLFKKIPVSIITGIDEKEVINRAYKYAIVDVLLKPFNERSLKKILEKTLNNNF